MVRGDLGYSAYFNQSVWEAIKPKIDVTVTLAILGVIVAIVVSIPAGVLSALFRGSLFDQCVRAVSAVGMGGSRVLAGNPDPAGPFKRSRLGAAGPAL